MSEHNHKLGIEREKREREGLKAIKRDDSDMRFQWLGPESCTLTPRARGGKREVLLL